MLDYSHPTDLAASAIPGRDWGSAQTSNMRGTWVTRHNFCFTKHTGQNSFPDPRELLSFSKAMNCDMVRRESDVSKTQHCSKQDAILLFSLQKVLHKILLIKHSQM